MTVDFVVGSVWVEYFGLAGSSEHYDQLIQKKKDLCKTSGIRLIALYPSELFSKKFNASLLQILEPLTSPAHAAL